MRVCRVIVTGGFCLALLVGAASPSWAGSGAVAPVDGPVRRAFDPPAQRWLAGHRGVDLLSSVGARVRAALAGRISYAGELAGRGVVVVTHGALRTTYEPVTAGVSVGEQVATGQVIGTLQSGHSCPGGTCLHWGLRRGEQYLDPLSLLDPGPLRLLPDVTRLESPNSGVSRPSPLTAGSCRQARGWACW